MFVESGYFSKIMLRYIRRTSQKTCFIWSRLNFLTGHFVSLILTRSRTYAALWLVKFTSDDWQYSSKDKFKVSIKDTSIEIELEINQCKISIFQWKLAYLNWSRRMEVLLDFKFRFSKVKTFFLNFWDYINLFFCYWSPIYEMYDKCF